MILLSLFILNFDACGVFMKKAIRIIAFSIVTMLAIACVYHVLSWKDTYGNYDSSVNQLYSTPSNTIDVAFAGSSHCYAGINPDVLWETKGISSFDMAISGQDKSSTLHYVKELCKTQNPQVVFVDLYGVTFERHAMQGNVYRNMLSMKLSLNAADLIYSYIEEDQLDYILRWPIVHTRYRELQNYDFYQYEYSVYGRGYMYNYEVWPVEHNYEIAADNESVSEISEENISWIKDFQELASKEGFDLYFMLLPMEATEEENAILNGVFQYLDAENITYFDFNELSAELGMSYSSDFADPTHLNTFGAEKLTSYIGNFLEEEYELEDHREDSKYAYWDQSLLYGQHRYYSYIMQGRPDIDDFSGWMADYDNCYVILATQDGYRDASLDIEGALSKFGLNTSVVSR